MPNVPFIPTGQTLFGYAVLFDTSMTTPPLAFRHHLHINAPKRAQMATPPTEGDELPTLLELVEDVARLHKDDRGLWCVPHMQFLIDDGTNEYVCQSCNRRWSFRVP